MNTNMMNTQIFYFIKYETNVSNWHVIVQIHKKSETDDH